MEQNRGPVGLGTAETGVREAPGHHPGGRQGHLARTRPGHNPQCFTFSTVLYRPLSPPFLGSTGSMVPSMPSTGACSVRV